MKHSLNVCWLCMVCSLNKLIVQFYYSWGREGPITLTGLCCGCCCWCIHICISSMVPLIWCCAWSFNISGSFLNWDTTRSPNKPSSSICFVWSAKCKNIHKITWLVSIPSVYHLLLLLATNSCCIISFYIPYIKSMLNYSISIAYFLIYTACFIKLLLLLLIIYMLLAAIVVACKFVKKSHSFSMATQYSINSHCFSMATIRLKRGDPPLGRPYSKTWNVNQNEAKWHLTFLGLGPKKLFV